MTTAPSHAAYERSLSVWAARHGLSPTKRQGYDLCGHSLLGRKHDYSHMATCQRSLLASGPQTRAYDHVRGFTRRGRTVALTGHAYESQAAVEAALRPYAESLGLSLWVGTSDQSVYYPTVTVPWILAAPKDGDGRPLHAAFLAPTAADLDGSPVRSQSMALSLSSVVSPGRPAALTLKQLARQLGGGADAIRYLNGAR